MRKYREIFFKIILCYLFGNKENEYFIKTTSIYYTLIITLFAHILKFYTSHKFIRILYP